MRRAGRLVLDHGPADMLLLRLGGGGEQRALGRRQQARLLELVHLLKRLHRGDEPVADLAGDEAVVIAGPGEVELDADALGERGAGIKLARRGTGWSRGFRSSLLLGRLPPGLLPLP